MIGQRYPGLEYMIVDGGSSDGSVDIIRAHAHHLAWWCSEADAGQASAINKGLARASGDIVGWVNSDDMLLPGCLHAVARAFEDPGTDAVCGWGVMMSERGQVRRRWVFAQPSASALRASSVLFQPAVFWRRSVVDRIGPLDPSFQFCMDQEYFARMAGHGIVPRLVPRFLAACRKHASTKTSTIGSIGDQESRIIWDREGHAAIDWQWRLKTRMLRALLEKVTAMTPPLARGTSVHRMYRD